MLISSLFKVFLLYLFFPPQHVLLIRLIKAYQFRRDRLLTLELRPLACQRLIMEKHPEAGEAFRIMQKLTSSVCKALVVTIHMQSPPSQPRPLIVHHCPSCHGNDLYSKKSWEKDNLERYNLVLHKYYKLQIKTPLFALRESLFQKP